MRCKINVNGVDDHLREISLSGASDIACSIGEVIECLVELKAPFGKLYQSASRQPKDQCLAQCELLARNSGNSVPSTAKVILTDIFTISLSFRIYRKDENSIDFYVSDRETDANLYVVMLLFAMTPMTLDELTLCLPAEGLSLLMSDEEEEETVADTRRMNTRSITKSMGGKTPGGGLSSAYNYKKSTAGVTEPDVMYVADQNEEAREECQRQRFLYEQWAARKNGWGVPTVETMRIHRLPLKEMSNL
jgi:hypothetical protein